MEIFPSQSGLALMRPAAETDVPTLTEIYGHYVIHSAATFETEPPGPAEMERRRLEILSQGLPYLVAETGGRVIGYAYAGRYRARPAYGFTVEDSVYVHPGCQRLGAGGMLLSRLIELCTASGLRQMIAVIGDSDNLASIRLHEKLGFRKVGVLEGVGRKFGRWVDTVLMQRALATVPEIAE